MIGLLCELDAPAPVPALAVSAADSLLTNNGLVLS